MRRYPRSIATPNTARSPDSGLGQRPSLRSSRLLPRPAFHSARAPRGQTGGGRNFPEQGLRLPRNAAASFCLRRERGNGKGGEAAAGGVRCTAPRPAQTPWVRGRRGRQGLTSPFRSGRRATRRGRSPWLHLLLPPGPVAPEGRPPAVHGAIWGRRLMRSARGGARRPQTPRKA